MNRCPLKGMSQEQIGDMDNPAAYFERPLIEQKSQAVGGSWKGSRDHPMPELGHDGLKLHCSWSQCAQGPDPVQTCSGLVAMDCFLH